MASPAGLDEWSRAPTHFMHSRTQLAGKLTSADLRQLQFASLHVPSAVQSSFTFKQLRWQHSGAYDRQESLRLGVRMLCRSRPSRPHESPLLRGSVQPSLRARQRLSCIAGKAQRRKARRPGLFEVLVITPPKESLGIHALPPDTHNGDQIQVDGKDFVVSSLVLQYKLIGGRYERDHNRVDVQELSRYFLNLHLDSLLGRRK